MTTAALPWFTGTSINPLLRSAHLSMSGHEVTLYIPWIEPEKQNTIYPAQFSFQTKEEHALYIFKWLRNDAKLPQAALNMKLAFYDAHLHKPHNSLYAMGETVEQIESLERFSLLEDNFTANKMNITSALYLPQIIVLEEPEHLNWYAYRNGAQSAWRRFPFVIGIIHTNYVVYARTESVSRIKWINKILQPIFGSLKAYATLGISRWMCAAHTHAIIRLSHSLPKLSAPHDDVSNVHGVRSIFLDTGYAKAITSRFYDPSIISATLIKNQPILSQTTPNLCQSSLQFRRRTNNYQHEHSTNGAYFIGKMLWQKGLDELGHLLTKTQQAYGGHLPGIFHIIGDGPHLESISRKFHHLGLDVSFQGRMDHADVPPYRVLINPSKTEVLCTTVSEALAMGKWVILPHHPSNTFFTQFPTCLIYKNHNQFIQAYSYALHHEPPPLSRFLRHTLSWHAATHRFCQLTAKVSTKKKKNQLLRPRHRLAAAIHCHLGRGFLGDLIRTVAGGGFYLGFQSRYVRQQKKNYNKLSSSLQQQPIAGNFSC
uniref:digalactosyldiacylglycerol synthase n=1 Tax=Aureoumbra lagunensis TaxID=44058 RepID=A0A7S3JNK5_9STRA